MAGVVLTLTKPRYVYAVLFDDPFNDLRPCAHIYRQRNKAVIAKRLLRKLAVVSDIKPLAVPLTELQ